MDEEIGPEPSGIQLDCKSSPSFNNLTILSVNQLLESVKWNMLLFLLFALDDCDYNLKSTFCASAGKWRLFFLQLKIPWGLLYWQVLETARQVASFPISATAVPYDQMKNQCEALVSGKQQKMSVLHSFKHQQETRALVLFSANETKVSPPPIKVSIFLPWKLDFSAKE